MATKMTVFKAMWSFLFCDIAQKDQSPLLTKSTQRFFDQRLALKGQFFFGQMVKASSTEVISSLIVIDEETLNKNSLVDIWSKDIFQSVEAESEENERHFSNSSYSTCLILINYL